MEYEVTLDILSGLSNPSWRLSPSQCAHLQQCLHQLPLENARTDPEIPDLGYRGLHVRRVDAPTLEPVLWLFDGFVGVGERRYSDVGRALERWLIQSGEPLIANRSLWSAAMQATQAHGCQ